MEAFNEERQFANYSSIDNDLEFDGKHGNLTQEINRKWYEGNWTAYGIIGFISSTVVFIPLSYNKPLMEAREIQPIGPCFMIHLVCSATISLVCLWNVFHTPSHGEIYKKIHRLLGRVGLIASLFGAVFGWLTAWVERDIEMGQKVALSIIGAFQTYWTVESYRTIRKKRYLVGDPSTEEYQDKQAEIIKSHREAVLRLWIFCLAPAWIRFPQILGAPADSSLIYIAFLFTTPFVLGAESALKNGNFWY